MCIICFILVVSYKRNERQFEGEVQDVRFLCDIIKFLASLYFFLQIRDFHIAKREEDIGYYAGYVGEMCSKHNL